jgi:DNA-3-methyladenine glycosylase
MQFRRLSPRFFNRPTLRIAHDLIGCLLVHRTPAGTTAGVIVETEAYTGRTDPGSHAAPGLRIRNAPMFGPPGRAYVYKCHLWPLVNVVTEREGRPGAVLLRALHPVTGLPLMSRRRNTTRELDLARGPGRLTQAMGIGMTHNRADLVTGPLYLARARAPRAIRILRTTRVGLRGPATRLPWRFYAAGSPFVSQLPRRVNHAVLPTGKRRT